MVASLANLFCLGEREVPPKALLHNKDLARNKNKKPVFQEVLECVHKTKDFWLSDTVKIWSFPLLKGQRLEVS